jgi:hypothetical protein
MTMMETYGRTETRHPQPRSWPWASVGPPIRFAEKSAAVVNEGRGFLAEAWQSDRNTGSRDSVAINRCVGVNVAAYSVVEDTSDACARDNGRPREQATVDLA